jgi:hypothetical protein
LKSRVAYFGQYRGVQAYSLEYIHGHFGNSIFTASHNFYCCIAQSMR